MHEEPWRRRWSARVQRCQAPLAHHWRTKRARNSMPTSPRTDFSIHRQRLRTLTPIPLSLPPTPTTAIMSDNGETEVENPTGINILPKDVTDEQGSVKLFNKAGALRFPLTRTKLTARSGPTRRSRSATSRSRTFETHRFPPVRPRAHRIQYLTLLHLYTLATRGWGIALLRRPSAN